MTRPYRVIFCGGREWSATAPIMMKLSAVRDKHPDVELVHGDGRGADQCAKAAAEMLGIESHPFPADWDGEGKAAGPLRNRRMAAFGVDAVYAFKKGFDRTLSTGGTEDMVKVALAAKLPVQVIEEDNVEKVQPTVVHQAVARNQDGMSTKCGLSRQHHSTCSGFQSAVTCPACLEHAS